MSRPIWTDLRRHLRKHRSLRHRRSRQHPRCLSHACATRSRRLSCSALYTRKGGTPAGEKPKGDFLSNSPASGRLIGVVPCDNTLEVCRDEPCLFEICKSNSESRRSRTPARHFDRGHVVSDRQVATQPVPCLPARKHAVTTSATGAMRWDRRLHTMLQSYL